MLKRPTQPMPGGIHADGRHDKGPPLAARPRPRRGRGLRRGGHRQLRRTDRRDQPRGPTCGEPRPPGLALQALERVVPRVAEGRTQQERPRLVGPRGGQELPRSTHLPQGVWMLR